MKRRPIDESDGRDPPTSDDAGEASISSKKPRAGDEGLASDSPQAGPAAPDADGEASSSNKELRVGDEGSPPDSPPAGPAAPDADVEAEEVAVADLGEDLVFEVLKRADARTLASAACVSRRWRRLAEDERLWEAVCVRHWANIGCPGQQLRAVVLALGGFRRLHSLYLLPLLHPHLRRPAPAALPLLPLPSAAAPPPARRVHHPSRWGKDEVQLSLSLLSIGFFEKMNHNYKHRGGEGGCG